MLPIRRKKMALITQVAKAVGKSKLREPFTTQDIKRWIVANKILSDRGIPYSSNYLNSILSNSDLKNRSSRTRRVRLLRSRVNVKGKKEYWFDSPPSSVAHRSRSEQARTVIDAMITAGYVEERLGRRHRTA